MPKEYARRYRIVAIGEYCRIHNHFLARDAANRVTARVDLRGHILYHDALAAITRLHRNQL
jgi:hypothetical protein